MEETPEGAPTHSQRLQMAFLQRGGFLSEVEAIEDELFRVITAAFAPPTNERSPLQSLRGTWPQWATSRIGFARRVEIVQEIVGELAIDPDRAQAIRKELAWLLETRNQIAHSALGIRPLSDDEFGGPQEELLAALTQRFGEPLAVHTRSVKNGRQYRASLEAIDIGAEDRMARLRLALLHVAARVYDVDRGAPIKPSEGLETLEYTPQWGADVAWAIVVERSADPPGRRTVSLASLWSPA